MKFLLRIKYSCWTLPNSSKFSNLDDKLLLLNYLNLSLVKTLPTQIYNIWVIDFVHCS